MIFNVSKTFAWSPCNKYHLMWQSQSCKNTKIAFCRASVGSNFLYRAETQSIKKDFEKRRDVSTNSC